MLKFMNCMQHLAGAANYGGKKKKQQSFLNPGTKIWPCRIRTIKILQMYIYSRTPIFFFLNI